VKFGDCGSLYTEGTDDLNTTPAYLCVDDCSDSNQHSFKFGDGGTSAVGDEKCITDCSVTNRPYYFFNGDTEMECTSSCPPVSTESDSHDTTPMSATLTSDLKFEQNDLRCVKNCDLHSTNGSHGDCLGDCIINDDEGNDITSPALPNFRTTQDIDGTDELVCHTQCDNGLTYNFKYLFE
jgi:hypothetical protein